MAAARNGINFPGFFGVPVEDMVTGDDAGTTPFNMMEQMPTPMIPGTPIPLDWHKESDEYYNYDVMLFMEGHSTIEIVEPEFKTMPADATIRTCLIAPPGLIGYNHPDDLLMRLTNTCNRRFEQIIAGDIGLFGKSPREIADRIADSTKINMDPRKFKLNKMHLAYLESDPVISTRDKMYYERTWNFDYMPYGLDGWVLIVKRQPRRHMVHGHDEFGRQTYSDEIIRDERGNIVYDVITERRYVDRIAQVDEWGESTCVLTKTEVLTDLYMEGFRKILMVDMGCSNSKRTPIMAGLPRNVNGFKPEITEAFKRYGAYGGKSKNKYKKYKHKKSRNKYNKNKKSNKIRKNNKSKRTLY